MNYNFFYTYQNLFPLLMSVSRCRTNSAAPKYQAEKENTEGSSTESLVATSI